MRTRTRLPVLPFILALLGLSACDEFDLGVAAFEIGTHSAILWTHVAPDNPKIPVPLHVQVATDPDFDDIVRQQGGVALPSDDFTIRITVSGLSDGTQYYYRFHTNPSPLGQITSDAGSFRTSPVDTDGGPMRFVVSGDSNLGYTAPRGLDFHVLTAAADEDPDFFVYFGDTIYADSGVLPGGASAFTLDEYREVHRLTRADPHLQTLLAAAGTFSGWDDHEVRNDYDGETVDPQQFANGARAFFEYLPLRMIPGNAPYRTDRSVRWGKHAELFFLDGRQFRDAEQFCNPDPIPDGPETASTLFSPFVEDEFLAPIVDPVLGPLAAALLLTPSDPICVATLLDDPTRSLLGATQLADLKQALLDSDATFKIIINNTPIASLLVTPYDRWEGYLAERQDLLDFIGANLDPAHTLVLTTDFHTNMAIARPELTEVIVGPIGQTTFATAVAAILAGQGLPPVLTPALLNLFNGITDLANGGPGNILGFAHDAFAYAVVDVFEDAGVPKLVLTARGNRKYALGANDPADVEDLFTIELP